MILPFVTGPARGIGIVALVLGGASTAYGVGKVRGAVIGARVMVSLTSGMNLLGTGIAYQYILQ